MTRMQDGLEILNCFIVLVDRQALRINKRPQTVVIVILIPGRLTHFLGECHGERHGMQIATTTCSFDSSNQSECVIEISVAHSILLLL